MSTTYDIRGITVRGDYDFITPKVLADLRDGSYESGELSIVESTLDHTDVVMEIGAGLGVVAAFCARKIGSESVHAWEANPALATVANDTFRLNQVSPHFYAEGLWMHDGAAVLHTKADFWGASMLDIPHTVGQVKVRCRDINSALKEIAPTYIICDAEGAETCLLTGADLTLVTKLCIEFHPHKTSSKELTGLFVYLATCGFICDFMAVTCRNDGKIFYFYRPHF